MTKRQVARWILCGVGTVWLGGTVTRTQSRPGVPSPFIAKNPEELTPKEGSTNIVIIGDPCPRFHDRIGLSR